jgi:glutathione S-transferase
MDRSLTFYTNPQSRGRIVRWMLEELGQPYRTEVLAYGAAMKAPEYRVINPMGKVPAIRHGEVIVTETPAICAYLADAFAQAALAPPAAERGDYYRWLFFAAGPLEQATVNQALGVQVAEQQRGFVGYGDLATVIDTLEGVLRGRTYVAGHHFSAADVYLGSSLGWGMQFDTIPRREAFVAYVEHLRQRPAWQRAQQIDDALMKQMAG